MSRAAATTEMVRRSVEIHPRTDERIKWLMNELEATSVSEVIRRALQVLETLLIDEKQGRGLYVKDDQGRITAVSMRYVRPSTTADRNPRPVAEVYALNTRG
jgi:hypothetical protein